MTRKIVMCLFKKSQVRDILNKLGMKIKRGNVVYKETGETVECYICGRKLTKDNVGNIMPGNIVLCDNPLCFVEYSAKNDII